MKKIMLCIACFTLALACYGQKNSIIELNGSWSFKKGDNPKWAKPKVNTASWDNRILPVWDWDINYLGYGWYRKEVTLTAQETYFFNLGQADDDCEVYFNGEPLKLYISKRPGNDNADTSKWNQWKKYRSYYIPAKLVKSNEKNTIAIRVWNTLGAQGGIRYGNIFIGNTVFYNQLPVEMQGNWLKTDGSNEWLIGIYNSKIAYKGKVWDYSNIKKENDGFAISIINGGKTETIFAKMDAATGNCLIGTNDKSLELCSLGETNKPLSDTGKLQNYTQADTTSGKAYFSGYIKDFVPAKGIDAVIELRALNSGQSFEKRMPVNADGTFSMDIPLNGAHQLLLRLPNISETIPAYVAPGKKTFVGIDPEEFKIRVTNEYYNRDRPTLYMGDAVLQNKLTLQTTWLNSLVEDDKKVWDRFVYTGGQYAAASYADEQLNDIAAYIGQNYNKYGDTAALKSAKLWSARTLIASPENAIFNSTFNLILQNLGEHLEGLQYRVKALRIAEKTKNAEQVSAYKQQIKKYVSDMIKN
ncbi:hypothetical protein [Pedobacter miscanthi]|uniref:hypothetical protein n=1 Tax=Pedobacter miscanthi TaxID=2259170 RepID=UPI002931D2B2|nr:hypothetical protein [Pedobacter miscanthi]